MGDVKETLRKTEMEASTMINHGGEYSSHSTTELFKSSNMYKDLTVAGTTVKSKFAAATAKWFKDNVMSHLLTLQPPLHQQLFSHPG